MSFAVGFASALALCVLVLLLQERRRPRRHVASEAARPPPASATSPTAPASAASPSLPAEEDVTLLFRGGLGAFQSESDLVDGLAPAPKAAAAPSRVKLSYEAEAEEEETTSPLARILITAQGDSDTGRKRKVNEDSLLLFSEHSVFAVADGMGGHAGGQVASSLAVIAMRNAFETQSFGDELRSQASLPRRGRELAGAIVQSNRSVRDAAAAQAELADMGTTLVAARFSPNKQRVYIGHVGDSRCYRLRSGRLRQLTTDHTMRMVGLRGPGEDHLFQAIGVTQELSIDLIVDKPRPDDVYLLCSDGLSKMLSDAQIEDILVEQTDLEAAVYGLIERANDWGGRDNVSVILIKVIERTLGAHFQGSWSKPPQRDLFPSSAAFDEVTVVGGASEDRTTVGAALPAERTRSIR